MTTIQSEGEIKAQSVFFEMARWPIHICDALETEYILLVGFCVDAVCVFLDVIWCWLVYTCSIPLCDKHVVWVVLYNDATESDCSLCLKKMRS